ncbi:hypothetical protein [Methylomonas sp. UP202]|uniref:hypothetical protein n=1 Tax=Methylomonas sp. UP202 TaxID=3040943 RepID=UPI00247AF8DE|nr:hypothetical protein [Methylomonas sp. UP202]WGS86350.1 hypothetical protein QC632_00990 [Methylomonas sp. UP202]
MKRIISLFVCSLPVLLSVRTVRADFFSTEDGKFRLSSFGTLGVVYDSSDILYLQTSTDQPNTFDGHWSWRSSTQLGIQASAKFTDEWDAMVQFLIKDRSYNSLNENLFWGLLRWQPSRNFTVRAGRLGLDVYLLSDYRNVGYAYLWERPPTEFYGSLINQNFDGVDLAWRVPLAQGFFQAKAFAGSYSHSFPIFQLDTVSKNTLALSPIFGGKFSYEDEDWQLSLGATYTIFDKNFAGISQLLQGLTGPGVKTVWSNAADYAAQLNKVGKGIGFYSIGAAYNANEWSIQSEFGYLDSGVPEIQSQFSGYFSIGRHIGDITPYVLFSIARPSGESKAVVPPEISGPLQDQLYAATSVAMQEYRINQETISLGARWDFAPNLAAKIQWDHSHVAANSSSLWLNGSREISTPDLDVDLFSLSMNWSF